MEQDDKIKVGDIVKMVDFRDIEDCGVYKDRIGTCLALIDGDLTVKFINNPALMQYYSDEYKCSIEEFSETMMQETFCDFRFVKVK